MGRIKDGMHTIKIPHINKTLEFPEYLGEFTSDQYIEFCKLMVQFLAGKLDYGTFRIHLVYKLLNMDHSRKVLKANDQEARNENIYRLSLFVDEYFDQSEVDGKTVMSPVLSFVDTKIPYFEHKGTIYHGSKDALTNITFGEYREAINHYRDYVKNKDEHSLTMLVATLYREQKPATYENLQNNFEGDRRLEFISAAVEVRAEKLKDLPEYFKYGVFLYFQSCQNYITTTTEVEIEGVKVNLSILFKPDGSNEPGVGLPGLAMSLAETRVFGDEEQTDKTLLWKILLRLWQNHLDAERLKRKRDAATK